MSLLQILIKHCVVSITLEKRNFIQRFLKKNATCLPVSEYKWALSLPEKLIPHEVTAPLNIIWVFMRVLDLLGISQRQLEN